MDMFYVAAMCLMTLVNFIATDEDFIEVKMPECCDKNYCFSNDNYPTPQVENLLSGDILKTFTLMNAGSSNDFVDRQGSSPQCGVPSSNLIYYIRDLNNNVRAVLQLEGKLVQKYTVATCEDSVDEKPESILNISERYKMECKEQTREYEFLVLGQDFDKYKIEMVKASLPVCCACTYHENIVT